jgi:predicted ATPase
MLADRLRNVRYLGPLRDVPGRRYDVPKYIEPNRWANGMAAWDRLAESTDEFVEQCGHWLESLGSGYQLQRRRFFEIAEDDPFLWMLTSGKAHEVMESDEIRRQMDQYPVQAEIRLVDINTGQLLSPQDVGVGISQVVPVIVSACDDHGGMTAIEQPELHLHPAMQVSLGDLFLLKSLHTFKEPLIIETHSEHLLLRVLRRIREQHEKENISPIWQDLEIHPDNICVVYVWQKNGSTNAQRLKITDEGEFMDKWPNGFFEERAEELF